MAASRHGNAARMHSRRRCGGDAKPQCQLPDYARQGIRGASLFGRHERQRVEGAEPKGAHPPAGEQENHYHRVGCRWRQRCASQYAQCRPCTIDQQYPTEFRSGAASALRRSSCRDCLRIAVESAATGGEWIPVQTIGSRNGTTVTDTRNNDPPVRSSHRWDAQRGSDKRRHRRPRRRRPAQQFEPVGQRNASASAEQKSRLRPSLTAG